MAAVKEDIGQIVTSLSVKLMDKDHRIIHLKIICPIYFRFDVIFMVLVDKSDISSTNMFINPRQSCQSELTISLYSFNLKNNFIVYIYGLKTVISSVGQYDMGVCYGNKEIEYSEGIQITVPLKEFEEDIHLPLSSTATQGILPVTVDRQPPSLYRLYANLIFKDEKHFIVFVKVKYQLRCYIINGRCFNMKFPFELPSASSVECKILCTCRQQQIEGSIWVASTVSHSHVIRFKTFLSLVDTQRLYDLAISFGTRKVYPNMRPIQYFYRNKSVEYFLIILNSNYLNGEMRPYLKSNGGEQGSVVNGRLPGLFFSSYIDTTTNLPNPCSHYGPIRLYLKSLVMFNPQCNLYFADFFCHYKRHHVTIILMPKLSTHNNFCRQYLTELNIFHNPYLCLRVECNGAFTVLANMDVTVDVFYTETINVKRALELQYGFIEATPTIGRGFAPPSGTPKNPLCKICNLVT
ncbi:phytanoyl-CoA hydroxylase interacting protein-like isoform X2 [Mytilus californianus]|uniref:phytanoyl-CoA hydroxylase interacting protein-like isoform X2 n=1 Tax=Mytilus californianus TaxID=6549 RepID=UPI00224560B2|nr:phytanoyl-CoA hydroxylase interacting protein-like isoform X2 [Mytilus californianus]